MNETMVSYARRAYEEGRIEVGELEAALDHIAGGGAGDARFPYLPAFEPFETEPVEW